MALVLPFLLLLLMGIIEVGRYAALSIDVENAARAGAQYGAQNLATAADTTGMTNAALNEGQNIPGISVTPAPTVLCGCAQEPPPGACPLASPCTAPDHQLVYVQVNARGTFNSLFNYPGIPASIVVNESAQMRVAQ